MAFKIRPYKDLPAMDLGWLTLKDHFIATVGPHSGRGTSLKNLLVIADAKIEAKSSFPKHPHKDMEILTWVVDGILHHQDDKESDQQVPTESLQLMSARDGIFHAEGNLSNGPLRILQIWIQPNAVGGTAVVSQAGLLAKGFNLMAAPENAPLIIRQDLWLYVALINGEESIEIPEGRFAYAVFIGHLKLNEMQLMDGDGAELSSGKYSIRGSGQAIVIQQNT
ncbi:MAG: pirin family protein [Bdellovibrio sp.]